MTIVIPKDENVKEIVIDVRDVLNGVELEFNAEKEFDMVFKRARETVNNFVTEFVFTIQKSDFIFDNNEEGFIPNVKKILKKMKPVILDILNEKFKTMKKYMKSDIEVQYNSYARDIDSKSSGFKRRFLRHIREQYSNIVDSGRCQVIGMEKGESVILGERVFEESLQLVAISTSNTSKKLGLDTPDLKNIKITELGLCPEKLLRSTLENITKHKKIRFKFNDYIESKMKESQNIIMEM